MPILSVLNQRLYNRSKYNNLLNFANYRFIAFQIAAKSKLTDEEIARKLKPPLSTIKEEEEAAATKIQAGVRGYLTRKRIKQSLDYSFDDGPGMGHSEGSVDFNDVPAVQTMASAALGSAFIPVQKTSSSPSSPPSVPDEKLVSELQNDEEAYNLGMQENTETERPELVSENLTLIKDDTNTDSKTIESNKYTTTSSEPDLIKASESVKMVESFESTQSVPASETPEPESIEPLVIERQQSEPVSKSPEPEPIKLIQVEKTESFPTSKVFEPEDPIEFIDADKSAPSPISKTPEPESTEVSDAADSESVQISQTPEPESTETSEIGKIEIEKMESTPSAFSKISNTESSVDKIEAFSTEPTPISQPPKPETLVKTPELPNPTTEAAGSKSYAICR